MRKVWLAFIALWFFVLVHMAGAFAQCSGPAGIPFNCQPGAAVGASDLILGGQNAKTVAFTASQLATFVVGAGQPGIFSTLNVTNGGTLNGTFFGSATFAGNVSFTNAVTFASGITLTGVTLTNPTIKLPAFLTAQLPAVTGANAGQEAWVSDCQNGTQTAGNGTGCFGVVNQNGTWILVSSPSNLPITIGGQVIFPAGSSLNQGNGNRIQLATSVTPGISGQCAQFDANLNIVPSGAGCGGGGGSGTVSSGTANQLGTYAANGTTISGLATANNAVLVTNGSGVPSESTTLPSGLTIPTATVSNASLTGTTNVATLTSSNIWTATASTIARASLNIPAGTAPTSPNNYDIWTASNIVFARLNGTTLGFAMTSSGGLLTGTSPISVTASAISCPTCATTTNGGALSGVSPISISAGGAISIGNIVGAAVLQWDSSITVPAATYFIPPASPWAGGGSVSTIRFTTGGTNTPSYTGQLLINGSPATCGGSTTFTVNTSVNTITCTAGNTFTSGQSIQVNTSAINGNPSSSYIQVNIAHAAI